MRYFRKAVALAWRSNRWSILFSISFSLLVGFLWGANIGVVYPFAEVIFRGQNLHQWAEHEIETANQAIALGAKRIETFKADGETHRCNAEKQVQDSWRDRLHNVRAIKPYIDAYAPQSPFNTLLALVGFLMAGTIIKGVCLAISVILMARVSLNTTRTLQQQFFARILDLQLGESKDTGDNAARMGGDIAAVGNAISILLGKALREPFKMFACLAGAAYINWRLLLLSLLACPIAAFLLIRLSRSIKRVSQRVFEVNSQMLGFFIEVLQGCYIVKAFGNEDYELQRFKAKTDEVYRENIKREGYSSLVRSNNEMLGIGIVSLSLIAGGYLVLKQQTHLLGIRLADKPMDFGSIMTFYAFLIAAADPIRKLGDVWWAIQAGVAGAERVYPLLETELTIQDPADPVEIEAGDIEICNLSFHYQSEVPVIDNINLSIRQGEHVAIVGPNGCGKSTLISLLVRFFDPIEGSIKIGGVDIRKCRQADLRNLFGLATQTTTLFSDNILENIRYAKLDASDDEVMSAGELAEVESFVTTHTADGYHSPCGERGLALSGGQRQRVAIARALVRDPAIIVLDEATSQVDLESERVIHDAFERAMQGRTAILVTQRPAVLSYVDRILVMNHGRIEAQGSHSELLRTSATYYELYCQETVKDRPAA